MWQIMWMLSLLPDWIWHILTFASAVAAFGPFLKGARRIAAAVLFLGCIFMEGGITNEAKWQAKVADMEAKVAVAEQQAKDANDKLDQKGTQKVKVIREKAIVVRQYINREVTKYDDSCKIPAPVVKAHNAAAKNEAIK